MTSYGNDAAFVVRSLTKRYGKTEVFFSLDLTVKRGEAVFVLGQNGVGKSTLLHCLAGLEPFEEGKIEVSPAPELCETILPGQSLTTAMRRRIGIVFQSAGRSLWPHKSVLRNVLDPLLLHGGDIDAVKEARNSLREFGIKEDDFSKYPEQLSGGEQQRVAIARAFAAKPRVLLLDEVTDHLDPRGVEILLRSLKAYAGDPEKTVIVVTHWIDLLTRWDGEVIVIHSKSEARSHKSSYAFLESDVRDFASEINPGSHELLCGRCSLEAAEAVMAAALDNDRTTEFSQRLVERVSRLLEAIDRDYPHLVLLVLREKGMQNGLVIRGARASAGFELNGEHVADGLNGIVREVREKRDDKTEIRTVVAEDILSSSDSGVPFGSRGTNSIIRAMFDPANRKYFKCELTPGHTVDGVVRFSVKGLGVPWKTQYCQFSQGTETVWLFAMEWEGELVGILSIDTYQEDEWLHFVVSNMKVLASMGAMWMIARRRALESRGREHCEGGGDIPDGEQARIEG